LYIITSDSVVSDTNTCQTLRPSTIWSVGVIRYS